MAQNTPQVASQDALTEKEINDTAPPASSASSPYNAFTELMTPKRKAPTSVSQPIKRPRSMNLFLNRDGLGAYTAHPEGYDASRVIYFNDDFVAINDLYPKSSVHTLLLPRSSKFNVLHPFEAFEDVGFLASVMGQVTKLRELVAKELRRRYGPVSKQDAEREAVLNGEVELAEGEPLPAGRDWGKDVIAGIHAHPSMNHLHIHVLSVDRFSEFLKKRNHYNSFATPFFVPIEDFPLADDDVRRHPGKEGYLKRDFKCWRCGRNFGNKFARLKEHLKEEFEEWKKE